MKSMPKVWRGERLAQICALIHETDPDVVEEWKWSGRADQSE